MKVRLYTSRYALRYEVSEVTLSNVQVRTVRYTYYNYCRHIRVDCTAVDNRHARPPRPGVACAVSHRRYERRGFAVVASSERLAPNTRSRKRSETSEDSLQRRDTSHVVQIGSEHTYSNT